MSWLRQEGIFLRLVVAVALFDRWRKGRRPHVHTWGAIEWLPAGVQQKCESCHAFLLQSPPKEPGGKAFSIVITQAQLQRANAFIDTEEQIHNLPEVSDV